MRPVSSPAQTVKPAHEEESANAGADWSARAGRLYADLERPARAMVRRAFRDAFSDDELDDIYANAWVGTLRALGRRQGELSDEEIRRYLLTAVANQASKELRRRRRKPTAPLEQVDSLADPEASPDERARGAARSRIARDLLTSLPPRRRAVMLLRYGWGLEPRTVCELVEGLSARAYRKEVTRGVDELTERMRRLERGEWCTDREPVLKAYAAGLADAEERRQAEAHLSHCQECAGFVGRLGGHLHDLGAGAVLPASLDVVEGGPSIVDRLADAGERGREALGGLLSRGAVDGAPEAIGTVVGSGGTRGALGAAGASVLAKLGGIGTAGKVAVACLSGGAAATACLSAGVVPTIDAPGARGGSEPELAAPREPAGRTAATEAVRPVPVPVPEPDPDPQPPVDAPPPAPEPSAPEDQPGSDADGSTETTDPVAPTAPPAEREWGLAAAATGSGGGGGGEAGGGATTDGGSGGGGGGGGSAARREFGGP